jgi:hypothetical protein
VLLPFIAAIVSSGSTQPLLDRTSLGGPVVAHVEQGAGFESPQPDVPAAEPVSEPSAEEGG